jgi:[acyl-carrier-protein] S-malonyltransferase
MQAAVPVGVGAMAALLGVGLEAARTIAAAAAAGEVCDVANDNDPGQVVLSGHRTAIERVGEAGKPHGLRRSVKLPVSAPFHCALMQPAADAMAAALADVTMRAPRVPVVANVTAAPVVDPGEIRRLLVAQVTGTVRWRESVLALAGAGVTHVVEVGAGRVLSGLVKRIDPGLAAVAMGTPDDLAGVRPLLAPAA